MCCSFLWLPKAVKGLILAQMTALQSSGLLGGIGAPGMARGRRGMSTPDLTQLPNSIPVSTPKA